MNSRDELGVAARSIRSDWERETWDRQARLYNIAVSNLLLSIAFEADAEDIVASALMVARAYRIASPA